MPSTVEELQRVLLARFEAADPEGPETTDRVLALTGDAAIVHPQQGRGGCGFKERGLDIEGLVRGRGQQVMQRTAGPALSVIRVCTPKDRKPRKTRGEFDEASA